MDVRDKVQWQAVDEAFPPGMCTSTGLWGWERVNGCLDLAKCKFGSRLAAVRDRNKAMRSYYDGGDLVTDYPGSR